MSHPDFAKAAAHITADNVRDLLVDLVDIASPTGREAGVARYLVERMKRSGLATDLPLVDDDRPNAVGHLRGAGEGINLLFTGHMDTSYSGEEEYLAGDGFKPKALVRDGWVWGLGANNMKSGLAAALIAIEAIVKAGVRLAGDISFGGVVGEIEKTAIEEFQGVDYSGYGIGSRHLVTHGVTADFALLASVTHLEGVDWSYKSYENINRWVTKLKSELPYYKECNQDGITMFKDWVKARREAAAAAAAAEAAQTVRKNSRA